MRCVPPSIRVLKKPVPCSVLWSITLFIVREKVIIYTEQGTRNGQFFALRGKEPGMALLIMCRMCFPATAKEPVYNREESWTQGGWTLDTVFLKNFRVSINWTWKIAQNKMIAAFPDACSNHYGVSSDDVNPPSLTMSTRVEKHLGPFAMACAIKASHSGLFSYRLSSVT